MTTGRFHGAFTALVTPFKNGKIDEEAYREFIEWQIEQGIDGLVPCGTTGESATMTHDEHEAAIRICVEQVNKRVPVIAGAGSNNTREAIPLTQFAKNVGADAALHITPYYNKPTQEGLYQHFKTIANAVELPIILYNIPGRCVVNMEAETTLRLANDCENVIAVKEASGKMDQIATIAAAAPEGFSVYSGDDSATYDIMRLGGAGVISTTGNVAPERMKELVTKCAEGKWDEAWAAHEALLPLMNGLFETSNPILVKEALKLVGFPVGGVRLPLIDATAEQSARLASIMREVGVL